MLTTPLKSRTEAMFVLIREYLDGPQTTQREFCSAHHIAYSTFQLYLSKYRRQLSPKPEPVGRFIPIALADQTSTAKGLSECEIAWPDGVVIRFAAKPSPEYLLALVRAGTSQP